METTFFIYQIPFSFLSRFLPPDANNSSSTPLIAIVLHTFLPTNKL